MSGSSFFRSGGGEDKSKTAALALRTFNFHMTAVQIGDLTYHGKAETETVFSGFSPGRIFTVKPVPYFFYVFRGYAYSVVSDRKTDGIAVCFQRHFHMNIAAGGAVLIAELLCAEGYMG